MPTAGFNFGGGASRKKEKNTRRPPTARDTLTRSSAAGAADGMAPAIGAIGPFATARLFSWPAAHTSPVSRTQQRNALQPCAG